MNDLQRQDYPTQAPPACEYRESEQLTHIDGFLVCYKDRCRITLRAQLSDADKATGIKQLMAYMSDPMREPKTIFVWQRQPAEQPALARTPQAPILPRSAGDPAWLNEPVRPMSSSPAVTLELPRQFLYATVSMIVNQPVVRQIVEDDSYVLVEEDVASGHHIKLILQQAAREHWAVQVVVAPPLLGQVVVTFGSDEFWAPLASNGTALFADLPLALLMAVDGPDMELRIV